MLHFSVSSPDWSAILISPAKRSSLEVTKWVIRKSNKETILNLLSMSRINDYVVLGGLLLFCGIVASLVGLSIAVEFVYPSGWVTNIQDILNGGFTIIALGLSIGISGLVLLVHGFVTATMPSKKV